MVEEYYLGGGDVEFIPINPDGSEGTPIQIGCLKEASIKIETSLVDIVCRSGAVKITKDKIISEKKGTLTFKTNNTNIDNLAFALGGTKGTKHFNAGDLLPDGTTAANDMDVPVIEVDNKSNLFRGKVKFIGEPATGNVKPVFEVLYAVVQSDGDISLVSDSETELSFSAEMLGVKDNGKVIFTRVYRLPYEN